MLICFFVLLYATNFGDTSVLDLLTTRPKFTRPAYHAAATDIDRYLLPAPDLSSKPTGHWRCCRSMGQTDGRTDGRTFDRIVTPRTACYAGVNKFRSASLTGTWWPFWRRWSAVHEDAELVTLAVSSASVPLGSAPSPGRCPFDGRGLSDDRRDGGSSSGWIAMMVRYLAIGVSGGLAAATSNPPWRPLARISTRKREEHRDESTETFTLATR